MNEVPSRPPSPEGPSLAGHAGASAQRALGGDGAAAPVGLPRPGAVADRHRPRPGRAGPTRGAEVNDSARDRRDRGDVDRGRRSETSPGSAPRRSCCPTSGSTRAGSGTTVNMGSIWCMRREATSCSSARTASGYGERHSAGRSGSRPWWPLASIPPYGSMIMPTPALCRPS